MVVGGVAAHHQRGQVGAHALELAQHVVAVHVGHRDVEQHDADLGAAALEGGHGLVTAAGLQHGVAEAGDLAGEDLAHGVVVVDQQDQVGPGRARRGGLRGRGRGWRRGGWEHDLEAGARAGRAVDADGGLVGAYEAEGGGEAEAATDGLGGEEGLEDAGDDLGWHAEAVVGDGEHDDGTLGQLDVEAVGLGGAEGDPGAAERDHDDAAATADRVTGVGDQVEHDLPQLRLVAEDRRQARREPEVERGLGREGGAQERQGRRDQARQIDEVAQQRALAGVRQHLAAQLRHALGRVVDLVEQRRELGGVVGAPTRERDAGQYAGQDVVDVVGHAAGEQPEALDALALLHAPLGAQPFALTLLSQRDVAADRLEFHEGAVGVVESAVEELHPAQATLAVEHPVLDDDERLARGHARQLALDHGDVVGVGHGLPGAAEQRGPAAPEEAAVGVVDEAQRAVRGDPADDIGVAVDHGTVGRGLAVALAGLGDVDALHEDPVRAPGLAGQRAQRQIEAGRATAGAVQVDLDPRGRSGGHASERVRQLLLGDGRPPRAVQQPGVGQPARRPGQLEGRAVGPYDHAVAGHERDEDLDGVEYGREVIRLDPGRRGGVLRRDGHRVALAGRETTGAAGVVICGPGMAIELGAPWSGAARRRGASPRWSRWPTTEAQRIHGRAAAARHRLGSGVPGLLRLA